MEAVVGRKYRRVHQGNLSITEFNRVKGTVVTVDECTVSRTHFSPPLICATWLHPWYFKKVFEPVKEIYLGGE